MGLSISHGIIFNSFHVCTIMLVFEVMYCKLEHILINFSQKELVYRTERVLGICTE